MTIIDKQLIKTIKTKGELANIWAQAHGLQDKEAEI